MMMNFLITLATIFFSNTIDSFPGILKFVVLLLSTIVKQLADIQSYNRCLVHGLIYRSVIVNIRGTER